MFPDRAMLHGRSRVGFDALLRLAKASVAEPPSFASIIDVVEDAASMTMVFDLTLCSQIEVRLQVDSRRLEILGFVEGKRARRVCALPFPVSENIESTRTANRLTLKFPIEPTK
jgi:hypothetical protein